MGACYSKNATGTRTAPESKTSKQKHKNSNRNKKQSTEELPPEKIPLQNDEESDSPNTRTSRSFNYDVVPDISYVKHLDHSIAPSDSGIESIGTWQDDVQVSTRIKQFDSDLLKHSEQWSLSFCHNCGHYKLQGHNGLTDGNILCCADDKTEMLAGGSELVTHRLPANETTLTVGNTEDDSIAKVIADSAKYCAIRDSVFRNDMSQNNTSSCHLKSDSEMPNLVGRDRHLIASVRSARRLSKIASGSKLYDSSDEINGTKAPLAQHDPLDRPASDNLVDRISTKQILLNDISLTAETICTCDTEYQKTCPSSSADTGCVIKPTVHNTNVEEKDEFNHSEGISPSLSRNGSFAYHSEIKTESAAQLSSPAVSTPIKKSTEINTTKLRSSFSESTSGVYTHKTTSESLPTGEQDMQQCSVLLGNTPEMLDDSSSECGEYGTEDDMTSIDMDNVSRVTPQSSSSFRQLNASSEHATSPYDNNLMVGDDGEECVVIPEETYLQLQTDLSALRQQLLCLSSLIEQSETEDQNIDNMANISN